MTLKSGSGLLSLVYLLAMEWSFTEFKALLQGSGSLLIRSRTLRHQTEGVVRGLEIASIDGVDFREGSDVATLNAGLFPAQLGEIHTFVFQDPQTGGTFGVDLESQEITSTPVQSAKVFERGGVNIGYVLFNDHIITAESLLIDAMAGFRDAAVSELILDLRYNGGGFWMLPGCWRP